jgi:L-lactate dehydrogenase complex protein LldG
MTPDPMIQLMKEKAEAVQAVVFQIGDFKEAVTYTIGLTKRQNGGTIATGGLSEDQEDAVREACAEAHLTLLPFPLRTHANQIHTSLTIADWGIAETGTLVIDSIKEDIRIATMLAATHVAVLPASRIKPDAAALEREIDGILKKDAPAYLAFITGASRTADIERVLAIGVHGPKELHILITG